MTRKTRGSPFPRIFAAGRVAAAVLKIEGNPLPSNFMPVQSKIEKITTAGDVITGVKKRYAGVKTVTVWGKVYTPDEIIAFYEKHLAAIDDVLVKRIAWEVALELERKMRKPAIAMTLGLKTDVHNRFGRNAFADFGWKRPKKPGPKTVKGKLAGVQKRAAKRRG
jgi:hypothetical protein